MEKNYGIITQGNIIRKNRIAKMWSQKQLAEEIGVKQNTITFWENGYRKVPTKYIKSLCQALGILEEDFFKPFYQEIDSSEICFDPQLLLQNLLHENKFEDKERFSNEFGTYLKIISENFLANGYELVAKKKGNRNE